MSGVKPEIPPWDSWEQDIIEANSASAANTSEGAQDQGKGQSGVKGSDADGVKGKGKQDPGKGKVKGTGKSKNKSKPLGWDGPYVNVVGRVYWVWRTYKRNGQSKTHRYYESDDSHSE